MSRVFATVVLPDSIARVVLLVDPARFTRVGDVASAALLAALGTGAAIKGGAGGAGSSRGATVASSAWPAVQLTVQGPNGQRYVAQVACRRLMPPAAGFYACARARGCQTVECVCACVR
jgi:hypothetical protein